ncbi:MAG: phosphoenolpyruvate--protein phosphotransferase [Bacteroidales bacterium]|nr:phosphoenolpyruvate--protein phosphotransferase [Bacteroidales bacterium]
MVTRYGIASVEGMAAGTAVLLAKGASPEEGAPGAGGGMTLDEAFEAEKKKFEAFSREGSGETAGIFAAHLEILEDPMLRETIEGRLADGLSPVDAVRAASDELAAMFAEIDDEYLRARADDVRDICRGLSDRLSGGRSNTLDNLPEDAVIVAEELFPSDTAEMDFGKVRAFVTRKGSVTSHVSIIARSKGIPALLGVDIDGIGTGDRLLVDGNTRQLTVGPDEGAEKAFFAKMKQLAESDEEDVPLRPAGTPVAVFGNAGSLEDITVAIEAGAEGIGLFRTEFVFMNASYFPTEEEQFAIYREAVRRCNGKPLIIRALDIGGDKALPYLNLPPEENPFLGMRGVRLCLKHPEGFRLQVRAILRAGAFGPVRMMIPMVAKEGELEDVLRLVKVCTEELEREGVAHDPTLQVGIMVETPAAVLMAPELARKAAFFSIGTNDLTQYTMAADRGNPGVAPLYNPMDPAVKRAIEMTVVAGREAGIPVGICGEMASTAEGRRVLASLGVDSVSLSSPRQISKLKQK